MQGPGPRTRVDLLSDAGPTRALREAVFVLEQRVPRELEHDALDAACVHAVARDASGEVVGSGRLAPDGRIGRMAVRADLRGHGIGQAVLDALLDAARARGLAHVHLHAQVAAEAFYARNGFLPQGGPHIEAGIPHQAMQRRLGGANAVAERSQAIAATLAVLSRARRDVSIVSRTLDPGLFDEAVVLEAFRRHATRRPGATLRFLLHDARTPQRAGAPLLTLAQRLPSLFAFRELGDPVDREDASAWLACDRGAWYHRSLGNRFDGEASVDFPARARQLREGFDRTWERSRPCSEFRILGA